MSSQQVTQQLIKHLRDGVAMEENVLRMLDSMLRTTRDPAIEKSIEQHKRTTRTHANRLKERLRAHGASPSRAKQVGGVAGARVKALVDLTRRDKPGRNARDGFATEQMEVASYHLLERVAQRAGDDDTVAVARQNRAEDEAMAKNIAGRWDEVVELTLTGGGEKPASDGGVIQRAKQTVQRVGKNPLVLGLGAVGAGLLLGRRAQEGGGAAQQQPQPEALELLSKQELQQRATAAGIPVRRNMTKQELVEALRSQPGQPPGARAKANPVEVQKFLEGVSYPAATGDLVSEAGRQGADQRIRSTLERLPEMSFQTPAEVSEEIGKLD